MNLEETLSSVAEFNKQIGDEGFQDSVVVVFNNGTIVPVSDDGGPLFDGYNDDYMTLKACGVKGAKSVVESNQRVWEEQRDYYTSTPYAKMIKRAYNMIWTAGYPLPAGPLSDRTAITMPGGYIWVQWFNLDPPGVYSTTTTDDWQVAVATAGECRRADFIYPKIAAVITANGTIYRYRG